MTTLDLTGAACEGDWRLFDSTDPEDHLEARRICRQECPVRLQCATHAKSVNGKRGTWAGELFTSQGRRVPLPERKVAEPVPGDCQVCGEPVVPPKLRYCAGECARLARNEQYRVQYERKKARARRREAA